MIRTSTRPVPGSTGVASPGWRSLRGRAAVGLAAATTAVLLLAGCAGSSTPEDRALDDLQQRTLSVTRSSADGDHEKALAQLEELRAAVEADLADGSIDQARHDEVIARIDAVRAQLEAARDAAETTPTPSTSPSTSPSPSPSPSRTPMPSPTPSPTRTTTPSPSATPSPTPEEDDAPVAPGGGDAGPGNAGNGNGNGKGNGGPGKPGNG
ncbi:type II secretory pathway pseudopilin PulG [Clavibacter michiganensis]|nr:type II secretory pathway pseudopilin PulG [Clavibacter michiganensis]